MSADEGGPPGDGDRAGGAGLPAAGSGLGHAAAGNTASGQSASGLPGPPVGGTPGPLTPGAAEWAAAALAVVWLIAAVGVLFLGGRPLPADPLEAVLWLLALILPLALLWIAAAAARSVRQWRAEAARLQVAVEALRQAYIAQQQAGASVRPSVERKIDQIVAASRDTRSAVATFVSRREEGGPRAAESRVAAPVAAEAGAQPSLALDTAPEAAEPLANVDFLRALNFPEDAEDREGFRALRRALADREASKVIRAAQDLLTLLSQEGIYMDDLQPEPTRPEFWRRFARGERGRAIAALGAIRDRSSLALTAARMRQDVIFRDAAHHFLRNFDRAIPRFVETASDDEIAALAESRTARAFMVVGRVSGTFD